MLDQFVLQDHLILPNIPVYPLSTISLKVASYPEQELVYTVPGIHIYLTDPEITFLHYQMDQFT